MIDHPPDAGPLDGLTRGEFLKIAGATGAIVTASGTVIAVLSDEAQAQATEGDFGPLFVEPYIYYPANYKKKTNTGVARTRTDRECIRPPRPYKPRGRDFFCKPAAGQSALLPDGRYLFINALEGTENSERFGSDTDLAMEDSQSRVIKINYQNHRESTFTRPSRPRGESPPENASETIPGTPIADKGNNDGDMFCSHQCHLPGGSPLIVGGTNWYNEPETAPGEGVVELEGNSRSRFFDWKKDRWFRTGDTVYGRWYPAVVPTEDGTPYVFGGVHKLEKPIYLPPQEEGEPPFFDSGGNIRFVEKFNLETGKWSRVGGPEGPENTARRSLPLQPRIKLLPNNHISFNGSGQAFSPNGQDFEQAIWNNAASFDPATETWTDHGLAGTGCLKPFNLGSKLSTFEVPLLMEANAAGDYTDVNLLTGGGTWSGGVASNPGLYFANNQSRISTWRVEAGGGPVLSVTSVDTGDMYSPGTNPEDPAASLGRWFGDGCLLPNGEVFVSSGADRDEVIFPGVEFPIRECEIFNKNDTADSPNGSWRIVGLQTNDRTYHNTNALLPSGEVIIGGHAPIPFGYASHDSDVIPGTRNSDGRDPTHQIYSPAYVADPNRPTIDVRRHGSQDPLRARTGGQLVIPTADGADIDDVALMRVSGGTHVNDTERRGVLLPVASFDGTSVTATMPKTLAELGGPGYYLAFIRSNVTDGIGTPSEGVFVKVNR